MKNQTYSVYYRIGGQARFQWRLVLGTFSREEAEAQAAEIKRSGYHALVERSDRLGRIGLPESWDAQSPIGELDSQGWLRVEGEVGPDGWKPVAGKYK